MSPITIIKLDSADSTNTELSKLLQYGRPDEWTVVAARSQTSGRGQSGNVWESEPGKNICCSILLYPQNVEPAGQFIVSMAAAVGTAIFLESKGLEAQIKWPNDIYVNDKKICGILIENQIMGSEIQSSVIGIGLNVNQLQFSPAIPNPTSLLREAPGEYLPETELPVLLESIQKCISAVYAGKSNNIVHEYHCRLFQKDIAHTYYEQGRAFTGIIRKVNKTGGLVMQLEPSGDEKTYFFKEISYLPPR